MKVCIIGGGISGLSSAILFAKNGHSVTLYEQSMFEKDMVNNVPISIAYDSFIILKNLGILESVIEVSEKIYFFELKNFKGYGFLKHSIYDKKSFSLSVSYAVLKNILVEKSLKTKEIKINFGVFVPKLEIEKLKLEYDLVIIAEGKIIEGVNYCMLGKDVISSCLVIDDKYGSQNYKSAILDIHGNILIKSSIGIINGKRMICFNWVDFKNKFISKEDFIKLISNYIGSGFLEKLKESEMNSVIEKSYQIKEMVVDNSVYIGYSAFNINQLNNTSINTSFKDAFILSEIIGEGIKIKEGLKEFEEKRIEKRNIKINNIRLFNFKNGIGKDKLAWLYLILNGYLRPLFLRKRKSKIVNDLISGKLD
jgi:2-polyprenyl-6-methoxyphenol hydroxylase-like FAD-dependent oxidoreductase